MGYMNITFDLETLGNHSTAPIVQIGAVKFDDKVTDTFLRTIKLPSLARYNFHADYDTIQWWMEQEDAAIKSVFCAEERIDLRQALREFVAWIGRPSEYTYWSHATFDPPILDNNFKQTGLKNPIPFRAHKDIRTLTDLAGEINVPRSGIKHNALDDCVYQAAYITTGLRMIKGPSLPPWLGRL